jgi:hypothetical protein
VELGQLELVRVAREALERVLTPVGGDAGSQIS